MGHICDVTLIYRTELPTAVVIVGRLKRQNDRAVIAYILTYYNGQYMHEHGRHEAQPAHFVKSK